MPSFKIPTHIFSSIVLCLMTFSYHSAVANQDVIIDLNKPISAALLAQYNRDGIEIDYDDTIVLKQVYVTAKDGAIARQLPSGAARKVKSYIFGEKLDVIEDNKEWYGIKAVVHREYEDDEGRHVSANQDEKVYIKKSDVGTFDKVVLTAEDLNILAYLSVGEDYESFEDGKALNDYLKIELIDKAFFEKKRPLAVDILSKDESIKKRNGVISIPTAGKVVTFTDKNVDNDGYQIFEYVGQIAPLNQYLVSGGYWESGDYKMIDKNSGETTQTFIDYPHISPNKKYIISAYTNPYEQYTDLELYRIKGTDIIPIMSAGFMHWMPMEEPKDIFWARDGYLYLAVTHSAAFWKENGNFNDLNDTFQYIRIKVNL
ncbi:MAG: hypothetical protein ACTH7W_01115 [Psychrobacter sp.]|uniref:SH3 domain-containing protein n=1 Tax=unclassified Psychrobacter TaxID=196806 RepID=UPI0018696E00|nr:SH3 domain-containing protein [Psychrobacter sp. FME61]